MLLLRSLIVTFFSCSAAFAVGLDATTIKLVRDRMLDIIGKDWEYGTATEALLELEEPEVSIFGTTPFPPSHTVSASSPVISIARQILAKKTAEMLPLELDGAVGDPASMGVAVLVAGQTLSNNSYAEAADQQLYYLLYKALRAPNGAISHRTEEVQFWADFVYMAPPFIAYCGALKNNVTLLKEAYRQVGFYRDVLRDPSNNLWRHVLQGSWEDTSHWGTGNAWAAAGAFRVLQTLAKSSQATNLQSEIQDLVEWTNEIVAAAWGWQKPEGVLYNIVEQDDFPDSSWTALTAAVTYRLAVRTGDESMISNADKAFEYIATHISADGTLLNVVNPLAWSNSGDQSPEGQAFVLLLQAAWEAYNTWKGPSPRPTLP